VQLQNKKEMEVVHRKSNLFRLDGTHRACGKEE